MSLEKLRVIHRRKSGANSQRLPKEQIGPISGAFFLDTCQRVLWIFSEDDLEIVPSELANSGYEIFSGSDAYSFLLRVATGLESQVVGETDVFGQLKEAWRKASAELNENVDFWIQKIFEDTKEIRSRHLQHLGGVSYGTLVRKFLKDRVHRGPTLLVGAGQLAQSVSPFLLEQEIWIINRSLKNAHSLAVELKSEYSARVRVLETAEEQAEGWLVAAQAILCVPVSTAEGESSDEIRAGLWEAGNERIGESRTILHLGAPKNQSGPWQSIEGAHFLDDLFELQKAQGEVRSIQIAHALRTCEERAKLRALGNSVSIHHGWEDLAVFASS